MSSLPRVPPLALTLLLGVLMPGLARLLPAPLGLPGNMFIATGAFTAGSLLIALAIVTFRRAHTTLDPRAPERSSTLVTHGVFALSRNPIYVGFALWLLALALYLENASAIAGVAAFVLYMQLVQIPAEESALRAHFGDAFENYRQKTRRWL